MLGWEGRPESLFLLLGEMTVNDNRTKPQAAVPEMAGGAPREETPRKKGNLAKRVLLWLLAVVFLACVGLGLFVYTALQPAKLDQTVRLTIEPGIGAAGVSRLLEEHGIIRNRYVFLGYLAYTKQQTRLQAGTYDFEPGMDLDEIVGKLARGEVVPEEMHRFTIPEGYTIRQIADRLAELGIVDREAFLAAANSKEWTEGVAADIPDHPDFKFRLEGYLFPETYEMKKDSTEKDIIERMLKEWDRKLAALPEDWTSRLEELGLSFHELLTIASLIEREVSVPDERPVVAGVIYNRLKLGMKLQLDATVQYLFDEPKERVLEKDTLIEDPYNTYQIQGLPPGPIASPGLDSIRAALYPEETEYLYYVTKKDGSGRHLFAVTYEEHQQNIAKSKAGP